MSQQQEQPTTEQVLAGVRHHQLQVKAAIVAEELLALGFGVGDVILAFPQMLISNVLNRFELLPVGQEKAYIDKINELEGQLKVSKETIETFEQLASEELSRPDSDLDGEYDALR